MSVTSRPRLSPRTRSTRPPNTAAPPNTGNRDCEQRLSPLRCQDNNFAATATSTTPAAAANSTTLRLKGRGKSSMTATVPAVRIAGWKVVHGCGLVHEANGAGTSICRRLIAESSLPTPQIGHHAPVTSGSYVGPADIRRGSGARLHDRGRDVCRRRGDDVEVGGRRVLASHHVRTEDPAV